MTLCEHISGELNALSARAGELREVAMDASTTEIADALQRFLVRAREIRRVAREQEAHLETLKLNFDSELFAAMNSTHLWWEWAVLHDDEGWITSIARETNTEGSVPHELDVSRLNISGLLRCTDVDLGWTISRGPTLPAGVQRLVLSYCRWVEPELDLSMYEALTDVDLSGTIVTKPTLPTGVEKLSLAGCDDLDPEIDLSMYKKLRDVNFCSARVRRPRFPQSIAELGFAWCKTLDPELDLSMYGHLEVVRLSDTKIAHARLPKGVKKVWLENCQELEPEMDLTPYEHLEFINVLSSSVRGFRMTRRQNKHFAKSGFAQGFKVTVVDP